MVEAQLQSLRAAGLAERDPVRFHYLQVLADRLAGQSGPVQAHLVRAFDAGVTRLQQTPVSPPTASASAPCASQALRELNAAIAARCGVAVTSGRADERTLMPELASVRRFGQTWSQVASEQQLLAALENAPTNAGPLNSQRLMVQALQRMHQLSGHYLDRFLAHANTLMWLEGAGQGLPQPGKRAARASRRKS